MGSSLEFHLHICELLENAADLSCCDLLSRYPAPTVCSAGTHCASEPPSIAANSQKQHRRNTLCIATPWRGCSFWCLRFYLSFSLSFPLPLPPPPSLFLCSILYIFTLVVVYFFKMAYDDGMETGEQYQHPHGIELNEYSGMAANSYPGGPDSDEEKDAIHSAANEYETDSHSRLHRGLKTRQISMIALGGALGTGLLINTWVQYSENHR
jgi:hypothetical protein